jgi:hypothetical protein
MQEELPKPNKVEIEQMVEDCYNAVITGNRLSNKKQVLYISQAHALGLSLQRIGNKIFIEQELLFGLYRRRYVTKVEHKSAVHRAREIMLVESAIRSIQHTHPNELKFFKKLPHKTLAQRHQRAYPFMLINFSRLSRLTKQLRRLRVPNPKKIDSILEKIEKEQSRLIGVIRSKTAAGIKIEHIDRLERAYSNRNPTTKTGRILEKYLRVNRQRRSRK